MQAFVFSPPSLPGAGGGLPIQYVLRTIGDPAQAYEVGEQVKAKATASGKFIVVAELGRATRRRAPGSSWIATERQRSVYR